MAVTSQTLERRRINGVAREYRKLGYQVLVHPGQEELPPFLAGFQPNLIVLSADDKAVVEVRTAETLRDRSRRLPELAGVIDAQPGWRLELVVTNPRNGTEPPVIGPEP